MEVWFWRSEEELIGREVNLIVLNIETLHDREDVFPTILGLYSGYKSTCC
jgi:hypothetical protein